MLKKAFATYVNNFDAVTVFFLLSLPFWILIFSDAFYSTFFGIFAVTAGLFTEPLWYILLIVFFEIVLVLFYSLLFIHLVLVVKQRRSFILRKELIKETFEKHYFPVATYWISLFLLTFAFHTFAYVFSMSALSFIPYVFYYLLYFVPYALIIEDVPPSVAFKRGIDYLIRNLSIPIELACLQMACLAFSLLFFGIFGYGLAKIITLILNSFFFLPLLVFASAEAYMEKYPIVRKRWR